MTYPTGHFDPAWVRAAALQHASMPVGAPAGVPAQLNPDSPLSLSTSSFTALSPQPERMTGCFACYNYTTTEGRVNTVAIDPTTTVNGSIVAYLGSVGGGVWKTTNCCNAATTWSVVTDDPLISTTAIDSITIDPTNHNTIYAGTDDFIVHPFSMGSQGILKSTDAGATWVVLGADVFGMAYPQPPGRFPQYNAVSKVRVDPNNSNKLGDYTNNWWSQGIVVDPNNPNRVFFDTFDVWFATGTGNSFVDLTCGYTSIGIPLPVHVDQHALAFLPGSSSILILANDGGVHGTINASIVNQNTRPTWFNMDTGLNTIEFYSGDISGNFANAPVPQASGGAQDNGASSVTFNPGPSGPVLWQMGARGDGFYARIDPVGTGRSLRFWQGNNNANLLRCVRNCTEPNAPWTGGLSGGSWIWSRDIRSFILPFDLFHGGNPRRR